MDPRQKYVWAGSGAMAGRELAGVEILTEAKKLAGDKITQALLTTAKLAREAAGDKDVRLGGGVNVIQQYLHHRLIDELHIAISPVLLGSGERLFEGVNLPALGYACVRHEATALATHLILSRQ